MLESITQYLPLSDALATAGQPIEAQLADVAAAGFDVVINLALHNDPRYSLADEAASVAALGMRYIHIPVQFSAPTLADLKTFFDAMASVGPRKVFVHCASNKRVPVFVALYRIARQGWSEATALAAMREAWQPDATWEQFIAQALAAQAGGKGAMPTTAPRPLKTMPAFEFSMIAPTPEAFKALYDSTGWGPISREASYYAGALAGSWCTRAAYCEGQLVGFARVISDGHLHAFVTEMIVHPDFQRRGIGASLLSSLLAACHEAGISDIQLFSARGKAGFYRRHGFVPRPDEGPGMQFVAEPARPAVPTDVAGP